MVKAKTLAHKLRKQASEGSFDRFLDEAMDDDGPLTVQMQAQYDRDRADGVQGMKKKKKKKRRKSKHRSKSKDGKGKKKKKKKKKKGGASSPKSGDETIASHAFFAGGAFADGGELAKHKGEV